MNAVLGAFECIRRYIRLCMNRSRSACGRPKCGRVVLFVRAEIEFERPRLLDTAVCTDARDLKYAQFVGAGGQRNRKGVGGCGGSRVRDFDNRDKRRKSVELLLTPIDDVACFASVVASGVIGLEAGRTIGVHLERQPANVEPFLGRGATRENTHTSERPADWAGSRDCPLSTSRKTARAAPASMRSVLR